VLDKNDDILIQEYLDGNHKSFEILFNKYKNLLFSYLLTLTGNYEESEDLFQEIFIKIIEKLPSYRQEGKFKSWLFTLSRNYFLDKRKNRKNIQERSNISLDDSEDEKSALINKISFPLNPENELINKEEAGKIFKALEQLNYQQREIILLRHYSGMTFKEISQELSIPIGTVLASFSRGIAKLRELTQHSNL